MNIRIARIVAGIVLSLPSVAHGGPRVWTTGGPYGGPVQALAIDPANPATLYAGTWDAGIFKSKDSGRTWAAANAGLTNLNSLVVYELAVSPRSPMSPGTVYAATCCGGVFKSTDSGLTWNATNTGLTELYVSALAVDPKHPSTLYAATGDGVFKSSDAGATWIAASTGLEPDASVHDIAIDPTNPATLYAGTSSAYGGGGALLFKSTDAGGTWTAASTGLSPKPYSHVDTLAIDPTNPATLYAGTSDGVFKSTDAGGIWARADNGMTGAWVQALAIDPTSPATLYAATSGGGVFKSTDAGATWNATNTGLTELYVSALAVDPTNPSTLYAGMDDGVFKSADSGGAWTAAFIGLTALYVPALAVDPTNPAALYAGTNSRGVFKSTNAGGTWTAVNTGLEWHSVYSLAIDPTNPATLYAGTLLSFLDGMVFKSTDAGATWARATTGLFYTASALAIDPTNPTTLYAGTLGFFAGGPIGMSRGGVYKSTDAAGTWTRVSTGLEEELVRAVAIHPGTPATVYAGACYDVVYGFRSGGGVFKSTNAAGTWTAVNTGLTDLCVASLAIDPSNAATLYAGTRGGVFKSTDAGATWNATNTGLTNLSVSALVIHPTNPATLYAGTAGGVFKSTDAGATWAAVNRGLPDLPIWALALDPTGSTTVYAGLGGGGVWQSTPPSETDSPTDFHTLAPCRVVDTRNANGTFGGPALVAGDDRIFPLVGRCNIPSTAWAVSVNLTVAQPTAQGHLRLYPSGMPLPGVSSVNYVAGLTRANNAIVTLSGLGELTVFCAQASGTVHFILDVNGYFE